MIYITHSRLLYKTFVMQHIVSILSISTTEFLNKAVFPCKIGIFNAFAAFVGCSDEINLEPEQNVLDCEL